MMSTCICLILWGFFSDFRKRTRLVIMMDISQGQGYKSAKWPKTRGVKRAVACRDTRMGPFTVEMMYAGHSKKTRVKATETGSCMTTTTWKMMILAVIITFISIFKFKKKQTHLFFAKLKNIYSFYNILILYFFSKRKRHLNVAKEYIILLDHLFVDYISFSRFNVWSKNGIVLIFKKKKIGTFVS